MDISQFTTYDDVRAVLGVSSDELEDPTLALEVYASHLEMELEEIGSTLPSTYATVITLSVDDRSALQTKFCRLTRLFATYSIAKQLTSGLPMFGPKDITDGKAAVSRFADAPYKQVIERVNAEYDRLRLALENVFNALNAADAVSTTRTYIGVIGMGKDRVTGR